MKRICVITAGHLSTCPRMLKAADAFEEAGYGVDVISTNYLPWATETDKEVRKTRSWRWSCVDYGRNSGRLNYLRSGVRFHVCRRVARKFGAASMPLWWAARAYSRIHSELVRRTAALPKPHLYYGGTTGALAAVAAVAAQRGVPFGLDLEDYHLAEEEKSDSADVSHALSERVHQLILPRAAFLTAGSEGIARGYSQKFGVKPVAIHNTFTLPAREPDLQPSVGDRLLVYWFSQTIGGGRGLEVAIRALGLADVPAEIRLRGRLAPGYGDRLTALARDTAPRLRITFLEPAPPDEMVACAQGHDVGLALEIPTVYNRQICVSNKGFTYMLAGLAIAFTNTEGQRPFAEDLGPGALLVEPENVEELGRGLRRWAVDKEALGRAKRASWEAAKRRWHWEHSEERGLLVRTVKAHLGAAN